MNKEKLAFIDNALANIASYISAVREGKLKPESVEMWGSIKLQEIELIRKELSNERNNP
jgi:hypothetical protein